MRIASTWIILYAVSGLIFYPISICTLGIYDPRLLVMIFPALLASGLLIVRLRRLNRSNPEYVASSGHFALGELFVSTFVGALLFAIVSNSIDKSGTGFAAVWIATWTVAFLIGLAHASMRGHLFFFQRIGYAILHSAFLLGICGLGISVTAVVLHLIFDFMNTVNFLNAVGESDHAIFVVLRIQLFFFLPLSFLSLIVFEAFFPSAIAPPPNAERGAGISDLAARMRAKKSDTPQ